MDHKSKLISVAQAEDTYNLLNHIAWTDVVKPLLLKKKEDYSKMLVDHLLGKELPPPWTKEQVAGKVYGINEIIRTMELILEKGEKALVSLQNEGLNIL